MLIVIIQPLEQGYEKQVCLARVLGTDLQHNTISRCLSLVLRLWEASSVSTKSKGLQPLLMRQKEHITNAPYPTKASQVGVQRSKGRGTTYEDTTFTHPHVHTHQQNPVGPPAHRPTGAGLMHRRK